MEKVKWLIRISGYGTFTFEGSEQEAQEMLEHKASWEHGSGIKWRADLLRKQDQISERIAEILDSGKGVPRGYFSKLKAAKEVNA